jgi:hypothetical protein
MENVFGNNAVGPSVDHPDYLEMVRNNEDMYQATNYLNAIGRDGFATGEYLTNLEKRHRMRAYRDGRMNLSLCFIHETGLCIKAVLSALVLTLGLVLDYFLLL